MTFKIFTPYTRCLYVFLLLLPLSLFAQTPKSLWVNSIGGEGEDVCYSVATDDNGYLYTVGQFEASAVFFPEGEAVKSKGEYDAYIQKYEANGTLLWTRTFGGSKDDVGLGVVTDKAGNAYVVGEFKDTLSFDFGNIDTSLVATGSNDAFLLKVNADGDLLWVQSIRGEEDSQIHIDNITMDKDDNLILVGVFDGKVDFDPEHKKRVYFSEGNPTGVIVKLDSEGGLTWVNLIDPTLWVYLRGVTSDSVGNVYVTGEFQGSADFDFSINRYFLTSTGSNDVFVLKLMSTGQFLWAVALGDVDTEKGGAIDIDAAGDVVVTGTFSGKADFDPGEEKYWLTSKGNFDCFIVKLDQMGGFKWAKSFGGNSIDKCNSIVTDRENNIYTAGSFYGSMDFDPGVEEESVSSKGESDVYIQKLDTKGDWVWAKTFGGNFIDAGLKLIVDDENDLYLGGLYIGNVDFGTGETVQSKGSLDAFLLKLSQCNPVSVLPNVDTLPTIIETCSATILEFPTATNTCGEIISGVADVNFPIQEQDTTIVTWTFDDGQGNKITQQQVFVVLPIDTSLSVVYTLAESDNVAALFSGIDEEGYAYQWYECGNSNTALENGTTQYFETKEEGSYQLKINYKSCEAFSVCEYIVFTGEGLDGSSGVMGVYPNPTNGVVFLENLVIHSRVVVSSVLGEIIMEFDAENSIEKVELKNHPAGCYFISVSGANSSQVYKVIRN